MSIEAWENRYTVRKFSETNREINPEHLKYLEYLRYPRYLIY